ncbi:MAG TPA: RNA-binding S4 domain-containing protein [Chloroflexi bacterium]|nr:RNA-binding S4 domain-containing protein [Chloroflexota bacterium]
MEETIKLEQFLKLAQVVATGGQAKVLIQSGAVRVNGLIETRRGRKLRPGDHVEVNGEALIVMSDTDENSEG